MRHCVCSRPLLAGALMLVSCSLLTVSGAQAQSTPGAQKKPPAQWVKQCGAGEKKPKAADQKSICAATYVIRDKRGRQIVSLMATRLKAKPFLEVIVPLGIFLPFGVRVKVDQGKPIKTNLVDCLKNGCRAFVQLDKAQIATLTKSKFIKIIFKDSKSQKALAVTGTLNGFGAAFSS